MAKIKSHTDLSQSKKLAEILPLESADMLFQLGEDKYADSIRVPLTKKHWEQMMPDINPCWSLAALLEEIPEIINFDDDESDYALEILKEGDLYYLSYGNPLEHNMVEIEPQENFVDACYEMILKLNELKML